MYNEDEDEDEGFDLDEDDDTDDCPTQEELGEGIIVDDQKRRAYYNHELYFDLGEEEADNDDANASAFWDGLSTVIAENNDESLRIFYVNDHGNVTEYDVCGRVIGEWV